MTHKDTSNPCSKCLPDYSQKDQTTTCSRNSSHETPVLHEYAAEVSPTWAVEADKPDLVLAC